MHLEEFNRIYQNELTPKQKKVLDLFLKGETDEQIAAQIDATHRSTTSHHLRNISRKFGSPPETEPDYRCKLVELFANYKPESVTLKALEKCDRALPKFRFPEGPEPLNSSFYLDRPTAEADSYAAILESDCLIRIKAPKQMGKTSLLKRILDRGEQHNYQTTYLNLSLFDRELLASKEQFLRSFAACIRGRLPAAPSLGEWDADTPIMVNCTAYFQQLLRGLEEPLVLALDEVDRLFEYPEIYQNFFPMLRHWHENANESETWAKLRLIVAHSTEDYGKLDLNQSPFNIGLPIRLDDFDLEKVRTLVMRHAIDSQVAEPLYQLIGGHPYLLRFALYHLARNRMPIQKLLKEATTDLGIYAQHLQRHLDILQSHRELGAFFSEITASQEPVKFEQKTKIIYQLESLGLIEIAGGALAPRYRLYREYFRDRLS
ncbi:AAA-like domain-containing protein [Merismopedia glauca]|uniref:HTH luxR-type domain-containing protein n=1 Tax=Merismopedia glauca CCAP 1448/3 TaxID=1296344 RepID=A0A2T1C245_9CYAN|nr:AAA-like domain-containing protein [Merismopedia glauca]PSB02346.1 hypothetical protein C7B64_13715 [Merismopedia glauca CCAP 1448/3]